jgi:hypothetical protein
MCRSRLRGCDWSTLRTNTLLTMAKCICAGCGNEHDVDDEYDDERSSE